MFENQKKLIIKKVLLFVLLFGAFIFLAAGYSLKKLESVKARTIDSDKLEVPKIYAGQNFFDKREIFRYEKTKYDKSFGIATRLGSDGKSPRIDIDEFELNSINAIYVGEIDNEKGADILAAGDQKAFILDIQGKIKKEVNYNFGSYFEDNTKHDYRLPFITIADVNNDGKVEIAGYGSRICLIIDLQGKTIWKYKNIGKGKGIDVDELVVADIDDDGKSEVVVTDRRNLEILNPDGELRLRKKLPDWLNGNRLAVEDFNQDGKKEILVGKTFFDENGEVIVENEKIYFTGISNLKNEGTVFLKFENNKLKFIGVKGNIIENFDAPQSSLKRKAGYVGGYSIFNAEAKKVRLKANEADYLVVSADVYDEEAFKNFKMIYVYDSQGKLVYQETLQAFHSEMSVVPNENGTESLIITDDGKINLYTVK